MSQEKTKRNPNWSRNELILALDFYLQRRGSIPNKDSQLISDLQILIHRAAVHAGLSGDHRFRNRNGVYMKLMNFRRVDRAQVRKSEAGWIEAVSLKRTFGRSWQTIGNDAAGSPRKSLR